MKKATDRYVIFSLDMAGQKMDYGVSICQVQEIRRTLPVTKVPDLPRFVEGFINLRGAVLPLIDLKTRFDFGQTSLNETTRLIIITVSGRNCAVLVDDVEEILKLNEENINDPPDIMGISPEFLLGVASFSDRMVLLLDFDRILSKDEKAKLKAL